MSAANAETRFRSLRSRALLAIALTVGFYVLAIVIAILLIAGPTAVWSITHVGNIFLTIAMIGAGFAILRSIIPPLDLEPPGTELSRDQQPELYGLLDGVSAAVGEDGPDDVYVDLELNAGVFQRGGRRSMLVGLPLLAILDRDELRAVIAHELGHYAGGDARFSAWIWRLRVVILQTVAALTHTKSKVRRAAGLPFRAYAVLFMRITSAVSRQAEFDADVISARVASPAAAGRALVRVAALCSVVEGYFENDLAPLIDARRLPPVLEGLTELLRGAELVPALDEIVSADRDELGPDPFASHPTVRQRLEALGEPVDQVTPPIPGEPASTLLHGLSELEWQVIAHGTDLKREDYEEVGWEQAGEVFVPGQRALADELGALVVSDETLVDAGQMASEFNGMPGGDLPRDIWAKRKAVRARVDESQTPIPDRRIDLLVVHLLAAMVIVAAADAGARVTALPGEPIRVWAGGHSVDPHSDLAELASGAKPVARWRELIAAMGLADVPLAASRGSASRDE